MRKLTFKQNGFVADTIKTKNPTQAIVNNYDVKDRIVAKSMASENLAKPYIKKEIEKLLPKLSDESNLIKQAYKAKTPNYIKWSEKHAYLETSLRLKGLLDNKQEKSPTNIAIIIDKVAQ